MEIINQLNWRYATKKFDASKQLSKDQLNAVLESIRLSPSSYGLQPYQVLVIKNHEIREKLKEASWGQSQITDASELIVFCRYTNLIEQHVTDFIEHTANTRGIDKEQLAAYEGMISGSLKQLDDAAKATWAAKQCYIALGVLLTSCATFNIDACPMEGFDAKKYDEILGLTSKGVASVVIATIGFRSADDKHQGEKKVRKSNENLFIHL